MNTKNNIFPEVIISIIMICLLVLLFNPAELWMPDPFHMAVVVALLVSFALFSLFVWREKTNDEREFSHRLFSGRVSFILGSLVLVVGIVMESFSGSIDIWLAITLVVMVLTKIFSLLYARANK